MNASAQSSVKGSAVKLHAVAGVIFVLAVAAASPADAQSAPANPVYAAYQRFYAGDPAAAQQQLEALRAADRQNLSAWFGALFMLQSRIDDDESLMPTFEREIDAFLEHVDERYSLSKNDTDALFHLAQAHLLRSTYRVEREKGMWGAARDAAKSKSYIDDYVKRHPEHGDAYFSLGLYNYYVDIAPNFVKVLRVLLFLPAGNRTEGLKQLERASRDGSLFAPLAELILADIYGALEGRLAEAIPRAEALVARYPGNAAMRFDLAQMYMHQTVEAFDAAAEQYKAILQQSPGSSNEHVNARHRAVLALANLRRSQWRLDEAITLLNPTIDQNPGKPAWVTPAFLLRRAGYRMLLNDAAAADDVKRVRNDPKMQKSHKAADEQLVIINRRARTTEAALYASLIPANRLVVERRWDEAKAIYDRVGRTAPGDWQIRYRLAYLDFARGNHEAAAQALNAIVTSSARMPGWIRANAMLNLAWTHDLQNRRAEAVKLYKRVVDEHETEAAAVPARLGLIAPYRGRMKNT